MENNIIPDDVIGDIFHYMSQNRLHAIASYSKMARNIVNSMDRCRYLNKWVCLYGLKHGDTHIVNIGNLMYEIENYWYYILTFTNHTYPMLLKIMGKKNGDDKKRSKYIRLCVYLYNVTIDDRDIGKLADVHVLILLDCNNVTDMGIQKLGNVYGLKLKYMKNITSKGVSALGNVHTLRIDSCMNIKNIGINDLQGVYYLHLGEFGNEPMINMAYIETIVDLRAMCNMHTVYIGKCSMTNNTDIGVLCNVHTIYLPKTLWFTINIGGLANVHSIYVNKSRSLKGMGMLGSVNTLSLIGCSFMVDKSRLGGIEKLMLDNIRWNV